MQHILFVTGTRADFGKLEPLARQVQDQGFPVTFFITGMHLLKKYGETKLEVRRFEGAEFHEYINQRPGDPQDTILTKTISGFSDWIKEHKPDLVVVHGDRVEALAIALVCSSNYIPCAHIEGGEVSGTIDEIYRHCISKLCRYHFVSSNRASSRLVSLGEHPDDIFIIGSPELDVHKRSSGVSLAEVRKRYEIPFSDFGIVVFHPVTSEQDGILEQARSFFDLLRESKRHFVVISPNNDPGSEGIFDIINDLKKSHFRHIPSMRFSYFSELMKNASAILGNSSIGVREAPFIGVPSLDIGSRQNRRSKTDSITHADASDKAAIQSFLNLEWGKRYGSNEGFGDGAAAVRFAEVLSKDSFWVRSKQKNFYEESIKDR